MDERPHHSESQTQCEEPWLKVQDKIDTILTPVGFETNLFKIGWYNDKVQDVFKLDYHEDTLAINVLSTPSMFEKAFVPFICRTQCEGVRDPIDDCMAHHFTDIKEAFPDEDIQIIHDFEMHHNRRPRILVQTAGHVSGAAYYYQRSDVKEDPWKEKKKIYGVSIHAKYGGWFAFRGVMIFKSVLVPNLPQTPPIDILDTDQLKIEVLNRFNTNWQDWTFRDVVSVTEKYSEQQKLYFATMPIDRKSLLDDIRKGNKPEDSENITER